MKNNEGETYTGHLHVYVTEMNSRWWNQGTQYHFAMVGNYALNQDVQINSGDTFHQVVVWDGTTFGMSDIAQNNVMVIASVFTAGTKYVDETAAVSFDPGENHPPNTPTITGEINGSVRTSYDYTITATDPDTDDVKYIIDWGDDTSTTTGFNESGEEVTVSHTWNRKGTYTVRVKAIDEEDAESEWGTLIVTMPMTASFERLYHFFEAFFERFPNAFPLLRHLLGF